MNVDDIYDADALGLRVSLGDKGNGQKFWHEKSVLMMMGFHEFLIDDVVPNDISCIDVCIDVRLIAGRDADYMRLCVKS